MERGVERRERERREGSGRGIWEESRRDKISEGLSEGLSEGVEKKGKGERLGKEEKKVG